MTKAETETRPAPHNWQLPFFTIWSGQAISLLGSRVARFALIWWLTEQTGSATVLATATMMAFLPDVFLAPFAGAYVDRWPRRLVMMVADSAVALVSLWLAAMFWTGAAQPWHVYLAMLLRSVGGTFHWPAMQVSTTLMVPRDQLARVSGLNPMLFGALNIVGPPLGALLMAAIPLEGVMLVDVGTAALAVLPLFFVHIPQPPRRTEAGREPPTILADMREGLQYLLSWSGMLFLIGFAFFFKVTSAPALSLLPLLVKDHFGLDAAQLSLLQSILGIGTIVGGVLLGLWGGFSKKIVTILVAMIIFGAGFLGLGYTPASWFWMGLIAAFVMGFALPLIDGPFMAIVQSTVAPEIQGRVLSLIGSLLNLSAPVGLLAAGPISDAFGLQIWYIAAGAACVVLGLVGYFIPAIMQIEENANGKT